MNSLKVTVLKQDRLEYAAGAPIDLEIRGGLDSPALNLSASFACGESAPSLWKLFVYWGRTLLFEGEVDSQTLTSSGKERILNLEARSRGAVLLDNEAMPRTLWSANLSTVFVRLISPYGFALYNPNPSRIVPVYTIYKGMSEWDAFCGFAWRMHGILPYVDGDQVMICRPQGGKSLIISNLKGLHYTSLEHVRTPYEIISRIHVRDDDGQYSVSVGNPDRVSANTQRTRYIIPGTEFADNPGLDAIQRIRKSMYRSESVTVRIPEIFPVYPGQSVVLPDHSALPQSLMVENWRYLAGSNGFFTELVLGNREYY